MCLRCQEHFTIHNVKELKTFLKEDEFYGDKAREIVEVWFERGYMNNLIYLEWKDEHKSL